MNLQSSTLTIPTLTIPPRQARRPGPVIVLVDDNPDDRLMVARRLRREIENVEIVEIWNQEALNQTLIEGRFDILVTDYDLRWSNGLNVLRDVRMRYPSRPVIMFTGTGTEEVAVEAMKAGLDDYVIKSPERLVRLAASVAQALKRASERDRARDVEGRLQRLFAAVPLGLYRTSLTGKVIQVNPALAAILGADMTDVVGEPLERFIGDAQTVRSRSAAFAAAGALRAFAFQITRKDGTQRWVEEDASLVFPKNGPPYCEGCIQDVTERRETEKSLLSLKKAVENLPIGVTFTDTSGTIVYANPAEEKLHGYLKGELVGRLARTLVPASYSHPLRTDEIAKLRAWSRERPNLRKDGTVFPAQLMSDAVWDSDGALIGIVTTCEDISERKLAEAQLIRSAMYDQLTGLPNRVLFRERLVNAWRQSKRKPHAGLAVLFLDLDRFKLVNDSAGHAAGDLVLRSTAERLAQTLRPGDTVARIGGDEFAILLEDLSGPDAALQIAERCRVSLEAPFLIEDREVHLGASIGLAMNVPRYREADELLRDADIAMYRAKAGGRMRCEVFEPAMRTDAVRRMGAASELRRAVDHGDLEVHYQPLIRAGTGRVHSVEALCRWRHERRGLLEAGAFIPLAEETGLITAIDAFVLRRACEEVAKWNRTHSVSLTVNTNLSALQFHRRDLVTTIKRTLAETGLPPENLQLELTETAVVADVESSARILRSLREAGVGVSVDDFGTGQACLASLRNFPVTGLKIDRSFVSGLGDGGPNDAIVTTIIALGRSMDLTLTAEGVEREEQREWLTQAGCDLLQGYLIGRPQRELPPPS